MQLAPRLPLTPLDDLAILHLSRCRFLPASFAKRFARSIKLIAAEAEPAITERQAAVLWELVWQFRRQIRNEQVTREAERRQAVHAGQPLQGTLF